MREEKESYFDDSNVKELVLRYEEMLRNDKQIYFDVEEFEEIVDHYLINLMYNKAFTVSEIACQQHPGANTILFKKAQVFLNKGFPIEVLKILKKMAYVESFNFEISILKGHAFCLLGDTERAEIEFDKALKISYDNRNEVIFNISDILSDCNQLNLAIKYLKKILVSEKDNLDVISELAICFEKLGDYKKSIYHYNEYLDIDPFAENIWFCLGDIYDKVELWEKAIDAYDFAIAINEQFIPAYFNKANDLLIVNKITDSISVLQEVLRIDDDNIYALCSIGEAYEKLHQLNLAEEYYNRAIEVDDEFPESWFGLGIIEMFQENYNVSLDYIQKAIDLDKENADYWFAFGKVSIELSMYKEAKYAFKQAVKLDSYDIEAWFIYADIFWDQGSFNKAIDILKDGLKYHLKNTEFICKLASYYLKIKNQKLASQYIKQALSLDEKDYHIIFNYIPENKLPKYARSIIKKYK